MNEFGIGIFNHMRSRTESPEFGCDIARAIVTMSDFLLKLKSGVPAHKDITTVNNRFQQKQTLLSARTHSEKLKRLETVKFE